MNIKINGFKVLYFIGMMDPIEKILLEKFFKSKINIKLNYKTKQI
jgi:hypothetical protein